MFTALIPASLSDHLCVQYTGRTGEVLFGSILCGEEWEGVKSASSSVYKF